MAASREFALEHVSRYRLTIAPVLGRVLGSNTREGKRLLEALVTQRALFRHGTGQGIYYGAAPKPLAANELREAFGVLWFACMGSPPRAVLPASRVQEIAKRACELAGVSDVQPKRCFLDPPKIALLLVDPPNSKGKDLQRVLRHLQRLVATKLFRPWLVFAAQERLSITYLIEDEAERLELTHWLRVHPLVAPALAHPGPGGESQCVTIPVTAHRLERLRGAGRR